MAVSGINNQMQSMQTIMAQMRQVTDSKMKEVISQVNKENGDPFGTDVQISSPSELLSRLSQLQSADPEKFKEVMNDIADKLKQASEGDGDGASANKMLADLSAKFSGAAETGDLSKLQPRQGPPPQGPPPPPPGSDQAKINQYGSTQSSSSDDDTQTILELLNALLEQDSEDTSTSASASTASSSARQSGSTDTAANDILSSIKSLLTDAFQKISK